MISIFVLAPLGLALLTLVIPGQKSKMILSVAGSMGLIGLAIAIFPASLSHRFVLHLGGWEAGIGVTWVIDGLATLMLGFSGLFSLLTLIYSGRSELPYYIPLHHFLLFGVNGCLVTADLFNLFVFFEVMLLTSFVQVTLGGGPDRLRHGFPYIILNLAASMILLIGVGLVYSATGTVNLAEIAGLSSFSSLYFAGLTMILIVFSIKAALVPYFFWLPNSYPAAPAPVAALFAALLTKVGVYAFFRVLHLQPSPIQEAAQTWLLPLSATTMLIGVLGALGRNGFREILSFHIVSQIGYMIFALALGSLTAVAAGLFFMVHNMIAKTALFFVAGACERMKISSGVFLSHPSLALTFFISSMSLAGIPPLAGFWAKFLVIRSGFRAEAWLTSTISILVSFLTLASMLKIWNKYFLGEPSPNPEPIPASVRFPGMFLALLAVLMGLGTGHLFKQFENIASQVMDSRAYLNAVLGTIQ